MDRSILVDELQRAMLVFLTVAGPPLGVALLVGLLVGVLQAATQVQDQTLPLTFKILAVLATVAAMAGVLFPPLLAETEALLDGFAMMTRH